MPMKSGRSLLQDAGCDGQGCACMRRVTWTWMRLKRQSKLIDFAGRGPDGGKRARVHSGHASVSVDRPRSPQMVLASYVAAKTKSSDMWISHKFITVYGEAPEGNGSAIQPASLQRALWQADHWSTRRASCVDSYVGSHNQKSGSKIAASLSVGWP